MSGPLVVGLLVFFWHRDAKHHWWFLANYFYGRGKILECEAIKKGTSSKKKRVHEKKTESLKNRQQIETISEWTFEWTHCFFHPVKISQDLGLLFYHLVSSYAVWHEMFLSRSLLPISLSPHIKCTEKINKSNRWEKYCASSLIYFIKQNDQERVEWVKKEKAQNGETISNFLFAFRLPQQMRHSLT